MLIGSPMIISVQARLGGCGRTSGVTIGYGSFEVRRVERRLQRRDVALRGVRGAADAVDVRVLRRQHLAGELGDGLVVDLLVQAGIGRVPDGLYRRDLSRGDAHLDLDGPVT